MISTEILGSPQQFNFDEGHRSNLNDVQATLAVVMNNPLLQEALNAEKQKEAELSRPFGLSVLADVASHSHALYEELRSFNGLLGMGIGYSAPRPKSKSLKPPLSEILERTGAMPEPDFEAYTNADYLVDYVQTKALEHLSELRHEISIGSYTNYKIGKEEIGLLLKTLDTEIKALQDTLGIQPPPPHKPDEIDKLMGHDEVEDTFYIPTSRILKDGTELTPDQKIALRKIVQSAKQFAQKIADGTVIPSARNEGDQNTLKAIQHILKGEIICYPYAGGENTPLLLLTDSGPLAKRNDIREIRNDLNRLLTDSETIVFNKAQRGDYIKSESFRSHVETESLQAKIDAVNDNARQWLEGYSPPAHFTGKINNKPNVAMVLATYRVPLADALREAMPAIEALAQSDSEYAPFATSAGRFAQAVSSGNNADYSDADVIFHTLKATYGLPSGQSTPLAKALKGTEVENKATELFAIIGSGRITASALYNLGFVAEGVEPAAATRVEITGEWANDVLEGLRKPKPGHNGID